MGGAKVRCAPLETLSLFFWKCSSLPRRCQGFEEKMKKFSMIDQVGKILYVFTFMLNDLEVFFGIYLKTLTTAWEVSTFSKKHWQRLERGTPHLRPSHTELRFFLNFYIFFNPPFREEDAKDAKFGRFFFNIWVRFFISFLNNLEKTGIKTVRKAYRLSDRPPDTHEGLQTFRNIDFITFQTRLS